MITASESTPELLDHLLEGCQVIGPDFRYLFVNDAVTLQGRQSKQAPLGRPMMEVYPGIEQTAMFAVLRRCLEERTPQQMDPGTSFIGKPFDAAELTRRVREVLDAPPRP